MIRAIVLCLGLLAATTAAAGEPAYPRARPLTDQTFERTEARIERGRYLTEHLLQCFVCHSERDWDAAGAPPKAGRKGAGATMSEREGRRIVAPNITPDPATGAGRWTDDMLARAIREGIGHDGRATAWHWANTWSAWPTARVATPAGKRHAIRDCSVVATR